MEINEIEIEHKGYFLIFKDKKRSESYELAKRLYLHEPDGKVWFFPIDEAIKALQAHIKNEGWE